MFDASYSPPAVALGGNLVLAVSSLSSVGAWLVAQAGPLEPDAQVIANHTGMGAAATVAAAILTLVVNSIVAERKGRRETEAAERRAERESRERLALSDERVAQKVAAAKAEADARVAGLEARLAMAEASKAESDRRVADVEARAAEADRRTDEVRERRHEQIKLIDARLNELLLHADGSSEAIKALIPAVVANSRKLGVEPPAVAPVASPLAAFTPGP